MVAYRVYRKSGKAQTRLDVSGVEFDRDMLCVERGSEGIKAITFPVTV